MIPKILHYCWFGKNPKPKILQDCLKSWQYYCPDFEIKEWNENDSSQFANSFYKNALRKKKYAFAADYVRIKVLYEYGGIYIDTDMLLLKSIDNLLFYNFFIGEEVKGRVAYGLIGAVKSHRFFKQMLSYYEYTEFNEFSLPIITRIFDSIINNANLIENELICTPNYFYPLIYENRNENYNQFLSNDCYAVHLWNHSWKENLETGFSFYISGINKVIIDYIFYGYSKAYFIRYARGFSRQIYYLLKDKF